MKMLGAKSELSQAANQNTGNEGKDAKAEVQTLKQGMEKLMKFLAESEKGKQERNQKIKQFISKNGSDAAKDIAREI
jgi:hypothetical protein